MPWYQKQDTNEKLWVQGVAVFWNQPKFRIDWSVQCYWFIQQTMLHGAESTWRNKGWDCQEKRYSLLTSASPWSRFESLGKQKVLK